MIIMNELDHRSDITAQMLAFDQVLLPDSVPEPIFRDEHGDVWLQISAPDSKRVSVMLEPKIYDLQHDGSGIWRVHLPVRSGTHYIHIYIDGADVLWPYLPIAYGYSRPCNYIALGDRDDDFYCLKDVPHGRIIRDYYFSTVTGRWESCIIYTPPGYDEQTNKVFPVLYLQHGHGENETGWSSSGKLSFILDNLIASGNCVPFVVAMNNGMVQCDINGQRVVDFTLFDRLLLEDIIPFTEKRYRAGGSKDKRALAGLSMGSLQTSISGFRHPELFCALGVFSGFMQDWIQGSEIDMISRGHGNNDHLTLLDDPERFDREFTLFYRAIGDKDQFMDHFLADDGLCERSNIRQERRIFAGGHDWNVWRQCIYDFSQMLFKS